jgi:hypothetical protein
MRDVDAFAPWRAKAGAHRYVAADGSHGIVISENDDVVAAYRNIQNYTQWVAYDTKVVLKIEDAVPQIMDALS